MIVVKNRKRLGDLIENTKYDKEMNNLPAKLLSLTLNKNKHSKKCIRKYPKQYPLTAQGFKNPYIVGYTDSGENLKVSTYIPSQRIGVKTPIGRLRDNPNLYLSPNTNTNSNKYKKNMQHSNENNSSFSSSSIFKSVVKNGHVHSQGKQVINDSNKPFLVVNELHDGQVEHFTIPKSAINYSPIKPHIQPMNLDIQPMNLDMQPINLDMQPMNLHMKSITIPEPNLISKISIKQLPEFIPEHITKTQKYNKTPKHKKTPKRKLLKYY